MNSLPAIDVDDLLVVRGGREILHGISLEVAAGSVTGLLGPSGCGKSTLMRAIVGVQVVAGGPVTVLGQPGRERPALRARVGYVTQAPSVYADLSVGRTCATSRAVVGADRARVAEVIATVGLAGSRAAVVGSLSGGQRSRVSLATALLSQPELLVLDEPTVGLDPVLRARAVGDVPRAGRRRHDAARLEPRHGRGRRVRRAAADARRPMLRRDDARRAARRTGEHDSGEAFLAVIEARRRP